METGTVDLLRECLYCAAESLREKHGWTTAETGNPQDETPRNGLFVNTLMEHLAWCIEPELFVVMMEAHAEALRKEADVLEAKVKAITGNWESS